MKVWFKILLCACCLLPVLGQTAPANNGGETRVYIAQDESARRVLENMLAMYGRKLVSSGMTTRPVSGRFEVRSVEDVMAYFESAYRVNWFQNGINVYTYQSSDWYTRRIYAGGQKSNDDWKDLFTSAGLFYKQFPFVFNSDTQELIVSGPTEYLNLVEKAFEQNRPDPSEIEKHGIKLMVFSLKYASVEDRTTSLRDKAVVTPGVLSVLLNLLNLPNQPMTNSPEGKKTGANVPNSGTQIGGMTSTASEEFANIGYAGKGVRNNTTNGSGQSRDNLGAEKGPSITADPRTNSILVRDAKSKYEYYKSLIDQLDKPLPMIEVEAMLVEVDQKSLNELGLEFGLASKNFAYDFPGRSVGVPSMVMQAGSTSIVNPARFLARLKALSADEQAKVLARPTIVTQDNVSAYIDLSQTLYLQTTGERVATVTPVTAGSLLQVTPRVVLEDLEERIFLRIEIQDGSVAQTSTGIDYPSVQNTSLSTQALIQRDKAILIGGYNRQSTEEVDYKVPVLGSLPIIGKAFSSTQKTVQTKARLFLITPRLIEGALHDSASTRSAVEQMQMSFKLKEDSSLSPTPSLRIDSTLTR